MSTASILFLVFGIIALVLCVGAAVFFRRRKKSLTRSVTSAPSSSDILRAHEPQPAKMLDTAPATAIEEIPGSVPPEVVAFVRACQGQGIPDVQIKIQLLDAGWSREVVDAALHPGAE